MTESVGLDQQAVLLSIVIPVLNEAATIVATLESLQVLRSQSCEIILADGGSQDATLERADRLIDQTTIVARGRASQMNAGAALAQGQYLLFLHADTFLPVDMTDFMAQLAADESRGKPQSWGFFPVRLSGSQSLLRCIEWMMNWRSRLTSVATGDQCLWLHRDLFKQVMGFDEMPLMEDVALSKKLRRIQRPLIWSSPVTTSSRRWEQQGMLRTVFLMWRLRLAYMLGASPQRLVKRYYR